MASAVKDIIKCSICLEPMTDPRMLLCQHTFCYSCLAPMVQNNTITCPLCRKKTKLPAGSVMGLPSNFIINELIAALTLEQQQQPTKSKLTCEVCAKELPGTSKDDYYCKQCQDYLCKACANHHRGMQLFSSHELTSMVSALPDQCPLHPRKEKSHICADCKTWVCTACIINKHHNHNIQDARERMESCRQDLTSLCLQMKPPYTKTLHDSLLYIDIQELEERVHGRLASIERQIDQSACKIISHIKMEQTTLKASLASDKEAFDKFINNIKDAKLMMSEIEVLWNIEMEGLWNMSQTGIMSQEDQLKNIMTSSAKIHTVTDEISSNAKERALLKLLVIPTSFSPSSAITIGKINKTPYLQQAGPLTMVSPIHAPDAFWGKRTNNPDDEQHESPRRENTLMKWIDTDDETAHNKASLKRKLSLWYRYKGSVLPNKSETDSDSEGELGAHAACQAKLQQKPKKKKRGTWKKKLPVSAYVE